MRTANARRTELTAQANATAAAAAAAEPFSHVGQMTVLNGGEGVNKMLGGILAQVGDYLPALTSALKNNREGKRPEKAPDA